MLSFVSKGFPYKDQIEEIFTVGLMVSFAYFQHVAFSLSH